MLNVSGLDASKGTFAPDRRQKTPYDAFIEKVRRQREIVELEEIEEIKKKTKEERTFAENIKLRAFELERTLAALDDIPTVIYVA